MKKSMKKLVVFAAGAAVATGAAAACVAVTKIVKKAKAAPKYTVEDAECAEQVDQDVYAAVRNAYDNGPNANPVYSPKVETPLTEDGKIDVMKLASPEDFSNWEEHGCQG